MKELIAIQGKLKAPKGQYNKFGQYRYRSCEDILEAVKPLLHEQKCQLTIVDDMVLVGNRIYVKAIATVKNEKGESETATAFAREEETKKGMDASQITGAASSYARKYALNGLFCIDDTKDSDATNTGESKTAKSVQTPSQQLDKAEALNEAIEDLKLCTSREELTAAWNRHADFQHNDSFLAAIQSLSAKYPKA